MDTLRGSYSVARLMSRGRLDAVDWLRGLAALWVVFYHANVLVQKSKYFGAPSFGVWAETGHRGVDLFFILSGFIMAVTVPASSANDLPGARDFVLRRFLRIFPAYLPVFIILTIIAALTGIGDERREYLLANLVLWPRDDLTSYVPVSAWTLTHELMFYVVFATAYIRRSLAISLLVAWSLACAFVAAPEGWAMPLDPVNLYFLVGVGAASLRPLVRNHVPFVAAASGFFVVVALMSDHEAAAKVDLSWRSALYMLGFAGLIVAAAESGWSNSRLLHRPFEWLGRLSYSLYLVHYPVLVAVATAFAVTKLPAWTILPVAVPLAIAASWLIHTFVEAPGIALGQRLTRSRPGPQFARRF